MTANGSRGETTGLSTGRGALPYPRSEGQASTERTYRKAVLRTQNTGAKATGCLGNRHVAPHGTMTLVSPPPSPAPLSPHSGV